MIKVPDTWKPVIPPDHPFFNGIKTRPELPFTPGAAMCQHGDRAPCCMICPCLGDDPNKIDPRI